MKSGGISEKRLQQRFMISAQAYSALLNNAPCKGFDHVLRLRATINVVTDIDFNRCSNRTTGPIVVNALNDVVQQVGAAVNVTDGIDSGIRRKGRV